jgi:hypothetical protein
MMIERYKSHCAQLLKAAHFVLVLSTAGVYGISVVEAVTYGDSACECPHVSAGVHAGGTDPVNPYDLKATDSNVVTDVVIPFALHLVDQSGISASDGPIALRMTGMSTTVWFDTVAPYHPTAVGVYSNLGRRPASESVTNAAMNTALLYSSHRVMKWCVDADLPSRPPPLRPKQQLINSPRMIVPCLLARVRPGVSVGWPMRRHTSWPLMYLYMCSLLANLMRHNAAHMTSLAETVHVCAGCYQGLRSGLMKCCWTLGWTPLTCMRALRTPSASAMLPPPPSLPLGKTMVRYSPKGHMVAHLMALCQH